MVKKKAQVDNKMKTNLSKRRPYFFTIMFQTLNIGKLRIPPRFVRHLSKDLSVSAILEGPFQDRWSVAVNVTRNHVYLEEGWEDFRKHHSLCNNELLLFRYDGNMHFKVQIFNPSGCERKEAAVKLEPTDLKRNCDRRLRNGVTSKRYKDSSDHDSPCASSLGLKNVKHGKTRIEIQKRNLHLQPHELGSVKIKGEEDCQMESQREDDLPKKVDRLSRVRSSKEGASKVKKETKRFTSKYPYTTITFSQGCLRSNVLYIPSAFSKAHMPRTKTKIILRNPDGEGWEVNCCPSEYSSSLCGGLAAFTHDNNIKTGDSFIFELIGEKEVQLHHSVSNLGRFTTN